MAERIEEPLYAVRAGLPYVTPHELKQMISAEEGNSPLWSALKQLDMIWNRWCNHDWEDAVTVSAEGITMRGFRVCFRCDKIKGKTR